MNWNVSANAAGGTRPTWLSKDGVIQIDTPKWETGDPSALRAACGRGRLVQGLKALARERHALVREKHALAREK